MDACSFGASSLKFSNSNLGAARIEPPTSKQPLHGVKVPNVRQFDGLTLSQRSSKNSNRCLCLPLKNAQSDTHSEDHRSEASNSSESRTQLVPTALEVESLISGICETSIAEFEMKVGGFRLYVMRDLGVEIPNSPPPPQSTSNVVDPTPGASEVNGSASSSSLAITKASSGVQSLLDKATDEGLTIIHSPRVGYFKRSRTIKGKRAPPSCKEKQIVKEGQVVCYVEQLGGELPIESDVAGEVVKFLCEDGAAVGYGDALIAILPSFPGIKKLH
ncbi:unnamed protein product [Lactuca virosa]|uniref:Lipoyl-binding domain-containing protein n=1 Tax=Lactuca virosa TaxID=75947 RepID=A0AAU9MEK8_9ASTR|nr:unnamed protein product [Lactuca virosa]